MDVLKGEARGFAARMRAEATFMRQLAALQLACGIDLEQALKADGSERLAVIVRLGRAIERERLRGLSRHWSYDLNRHIALKEVLQRLRDEPRTAPDPAGRAKRRQRRAERKPGMEPKTAP